MKKIISSIIAFSLLLNLFCVYQAFANGLQDITSGWYIADTDTAVTAETTESYFTTAVPAVK